MSFLCLYITALFLVELARSTVSRVVLQMASNDTKWQKDAADQNFDYMFKLLIIGNSSVGKTSFLFRYADDSFTSAFVSTVGIDFKVKTVFRQDKRVKLQIWVSRPIASRFFGLSKKKETTALNLCRYFITMLICLVQRTQLIAE